MTEKIFYAVMIISIVILAVMGIVGYVGLKKRVFTVENNKEPDFFEFEEEIHRSVDGLAELELRVEARTRIQNIYYALYSIQGEFYKTCWSDLGLESTEFEAVLAELIKEARKELEIHTRGIEELKEKLKLKFEGEKENAETKEKQQSEGSDRCGASADRVRDRADGKSA